MMKLLVRQTNMNVISSLHSIRGGHRVCFCLC